MKNVKLMKLTSDDSADKNPKSQNWKNFSSMKTVIISTTVGERLYTCTQASRLLLGPCENLQFDDYFEIIMIL